MHLQTIVDSPELFIGYDTKNQWLYVDWKGEHDQASSRLACELMLDALRAWPCHKLLNDNSSIIRTTAQFTLWGEWWRAEMRAAGLQYTAWVLPRDLLTLRVTESLIRSIDSPYVGTFDDVASAYVWLQQQHPVLCP